MGARLVLICHSAKLAEGLLELVQQVAQGKVRAFAAGGLDESTLGSNPDEIQAVLEQADNPEGVLVLMDIGSSILATEMVLSEWSAERRARVYLCEGPLVEGAVAAAAQLAAGAPLEEAAEEARKALQPKAAQLGLSTATAQHPLIALDQQVTLTVNHPMGLHARPAAVFVQTAQRFQSQIQVQHGEREANAKSILSILALGANQGAVITVSARGPDAGEALGALESLVGSDFGGTA